MGRSLALAVLSALLLSVTQAAEQRVSFNDGTVHKIAAYLAEAHGMAATTTGESRDDSPALETDEEENALLETGAALGTLSGSLIALMVVMGFARKLLRRWFRVAHRGVAIALLAVLAGHWTVMLVGWGATSAAWHLSGALAGVAVIGAVVVALVRRRMKWRRFLATHISLALVALALLTLHVVLRLV